MPEAGWRRFRFPFVFRERPSLLALEATATYDNKPTLAIGRVRIYHAREPINFSGRFAGDLDFSRVPASPDGIRPGTIWVDRAAGNVLKLS